MKIMAICKLMITDFMIGDCSEMLGTTTYDENNLRCGIAWCDCLIEEYGFTHDPHYGYNLLDFKNWAIGKLIDRGLALNKLLIKE